MDNNKVWLITGAGRGMGFEITKAALAAGHKVIASGRNTDSVAKAIGEAEIFWLQSWTLPAKQMPVLPFMLLLKSLVA